MKNAKPDDQEKQRKAISDMMSSDTKLRSKKKLIEKFMDQNMKKISDSDEIETSFDDFWTHEKKKAFKLLSEEEDLHYDRLVVTVSNYLFTHKEPLRDEVIALMNQRPSLKDRGSASNRIKEKIVDFVETFIEGMV
ncbi:MAG: hypothetical protein RIA69_13525 [Cyclobacteriaceae bacterium]